MRVKPSPLVLAALALLALAACDDEPSGPASAASATPRPAYEGPMFLEVDPANSYAGGAAGKVVDCTTFGRGDTNTEKELFGYTGDTPEEALAADGAAFLVAYEGAIDGMERVRAEGDRVLFAAKVDGVIKQAVVLRHIEGDPRGGGPGWTVESFAQCDDAELPRSFVEERGRQVWTDEDGVPVPSTTLISRQGPAHCDWDSLTYLRIGQATYVRNPEELKSPGTEPFQASVEVPADAEDTGFRRDGDRLWISADEQHAYVGSADDAEVWPLGGGPSGCA